MKMQYRRLGRSGLQVSVLSFGSWVTFGTQVDTGLARDCLGDGRRRRGQLLRQRRGLRRRRVRADHGRGHRRARLAPAVLRDLDQGLLGHRTTRSTCGTRSTASTCMQAIDGSLRAPRPRLRRPALLPPARPRARRSRRRSGRCPTSVELGQGPLLGHVGVDRRRDPRRVGDRRPPPPAQAGGRAAAVQPVRAPEGRAASTSASTTTSASASPPGARWPRGCSPASTSTASPTAAAPPLPGYEWLKGDAHRPAPSNAMVRDLAAIADAARCTTGAARHRLVRSQPATSRR